MSHALFTHWALVILWVSVCHYYDLSCFSFRTFFADIRCGALFTPWYSDLLNDSCRSKWISWLLFICGYQISKFISNIHIHLIPQIHSGTLMQSHSITFWMNVYIHNDKYIISLSVANLRYILYSRQISCSQEHLLSFSFSIITFYAAIYIALIACLLIEIYIKMFSCSGEISFGQIWYCLRHWLCSGRHLNHLCHRLCCRCH